MSSSSIDRPDDFFTGFPNRNYDRLSAIEEASTEETETG